MLLHDILAFAGKFAVAVTFLIAAVILLAWFFDKQGRRRTEQSEIRFKIPGDIFAQDEY